MATKWQWVPERQLYRRLSDMDVAQTIGMAEAADVLNEIVPLRVQLEAAQAEAAAMRGTLEHEHRCLGDLLDVFDHPGTFEWEAQHYEPHEALQAGIDALSGTAGQALLDRLAELGAQVAAFNQPVPLSEWKRMEARLEKLKAVAEAAERCIGHCGRLTETSQRCDLRAALYAIRSLPRAAGYLKEGE